MPTWLDQTLEQLRGAPRWLTLTQIASEADVQLSWLSALSAGKITDPGVTKLQRVHDYLKLLPKQQPPEQIVWDSTAMKTTRSMHAGTYVVYNDDGACVYVGSSKNVFKRLRDHARNPDIWSHKPTRVIVTWIDEDGDPFGKRRHELERCKIRALAPLVNIKGKAKV